MVEQYKLEIATPKGIFTDTFPKTTKVRDVIKAVIEKQDLPGGDVYELFYKVLSSAIN